MDTKIGLPFRLAFSKTSGDQGYQSTGLCACSNRYGLVSRADRLVCRGACGGVFVAVSAVGGGGPGLATARPGEPAVTRTAVATNARPTFSQTSDRRRPQNAADCMRPSLPNPSVAAVKRDIRPVPPG